MEDIIIRNNPEEKRFEVELGNELAVIEYSWHNGNLVALHTYVPDTYRGKGIAGRMIKQMLEYLKTNHIKLIIRCPAVGKYMESHPEYHDLLDPEHAGHQ